MSPRPIQSISCDVCLWVCVFVVPSVGDWNLKELETSGQRAYRYNCKTKKPFYLEGGHFFLEFFMSFGFLGFCLDKPAACAWWGELAEGRSVEVAVDVGDRCLKLYSNINVAVQTAILQFKEQIVAVCMICLIVSISLNKEVIV